MSGIFGSVTIKGNRITDFAQTTATVGIPLPFGYGIVPFDGNVTWAALPPKEHVSKKRQGKGGTKVETYTYTLSYMVSFCQGPIFGFWWIKRNGKVVWTQDPNAPVEDQAYAAKWAQKVQFYFGTETQLPDSTIESYEGVGNVSAHRGVAGFVVEDDDVTDGSGAVPTYEACCMCTPPEAYLTSEIYPQYFADQAQYAAVPTGGELRNIRIHSDIQSDAAEYAMAPTGGIIRPLVVPVEVESEHVEYAMVPTGGQLRNVRVPARLGDDEATYAMAPTGGVVRQTAKGRMEDEPTYAMAPTGGTISTP